MKGIILNKLLLPVHPAQYLGRIKASEVKSTIEVIWNNPYPACPVLEPEFVGLSYGQVAILKQVLLASQGDPGAFDRVLDRMVGRPLQVNKNMNVNKNYRDFLLDIAVEEGLIVNSEGPGNTDNPQALK